MTKCIETCPVCGVTIEDGAKVIFSASPSGTKSRLWARVCNFVQHPDCINDFDVTDKNSVVKSTDYYK